MTAKPSEIFETMEYGHAFENADIAMDWLSQHDKGIMHFIGGTWVKPTSGKFFDTKNPATGDTLAQVADGNAEDIDLAVKSANEAFPIWQKLGGYKRAKCLYALARLIQKNARLIAVIETLDNGKPIRETRDADVQLAVRHFYHHAGWAQMLEDKFSGYEAHGVVGQIIPWNFPFLMLAWKIAPALAAGNTVVLKPAEFTPLSAALFAELCQEAGLPDGVVNIVQGDGKAGSALVKHNGVNKIAFTGSTDVGRLIRAETAGTAKGLTLELGGKSPAIVFENADLDAAVEGIVDGIWFNQGEVCCATSRLLVQEGVAAKMIKKLERRMKTLRIGNPLDKCIDMGAIIDESQKTRIDGLVKQGVKEGAVLHQPTAKDCPTEGCFYPPTMLTNVHPASTVAETEIFGPVVSVITFRTQDEAVQIANNSRYGLAAGIWTENINLALDVAPKLKAGVIWINSANLFDPAQIRRTSMNLAQRTEAAVLFEKGLDLYEDKPSEKINPAKRNNAISGLDNIDRTPKMYIGGKQTRPDGNYTLNITNTVGEIVGQVGEGSRKDIRNAVEAASKATSWSSATHHLRAQILYYIAENLDIRKSEFADRIASMTGETGKSALKEVEVSVERLFYYAGWCDKYDGDVHTPPMRAVSVAMKEPVGTMGLVCPDEAPLLGLISLVAPAIAMGNRTIVIPSEKYPLAATDFYQILETSDLPAGVINIVTGHKQDLVKTMAEHDNLDALWYFGSDVAGSQLVEASSTSNLKRTWVNNGLQRDWFNSEHAQGEEYLRHAVEIKNIWIPYGE